CRLISSREKCIVRLGTLISSECVCVRVLPSPARLFYLRLNQRTFHQPFRTQSTVRTVDSQRLRCGSSAETGSRSSIQAPPTPSSISSVLTQVILTRRA